MELFWTNKDSKTRPKMKGIFINNVNKFLTTQCLWELQAFLVFNFKSLIFNILKIPKLPQPLWDKDSLISKKE